MALGGRPLAAALAVLVLGGALTTVPGTAAAVRVPDPTPQDLQLNDELLALAARSDRAAVASGGFEVSLRVGSQRRFFQVDFSTGYMRGRLGDCSEPPNCQVSDGRDRFWVELGRDRDTRAVLKLLGRLDATHIAAPGLQEPFEVTWPGRSSGAWLRQMVGPGSVVTGATKTTLDDGRVRYSAVQWVDSQRSRFWVIGADGRVVEMGGRPWAAPLSFRYGPQQIQLPGGTAAVPLGLWFAGMRAYAAPSIVHGAARTLRRRAAAAIAGESGSNPVALIRREALRLYRRGSYGGGTFIRRDPGGALVFFKNRVRVYAEAVVWEPSTGRVRIEPRPGWQP